MVLVFQYGSNTLEKRINSPNRLNGSAKFVDVAYTKELYELVFTIESKTNECAAADIIKGKGRNIWGVLYDIPENRVFRNKHSNGEKCLDQIEGEGRNYRRETIRVITSKADEISVITYIGNNRIEGLKTSYKYVKNIIYGLKSYPIPEEYIDYVISKIIDNNPKLMSLLE